MKVILSVHVVGIAAVALQLAVATLTAADCVPNCSSGTDDVRQIDPYPVEASAGARTIPDFANGGTVTLSDSQLIDVVILGDGYTNGTRECFFDAACDWYRDLFDPNTGIRPYNDFAQAFRVRAVFTESEREVSGPDDDDRQSYYRLLAEIDSGVPTGLATVSGWWNAEGEANEEFRTKLFDAIDAVTPAVNLAKYPSDLVRPLPSADSDYFRYENDEKGEHQDYLPGVSNRYSNLILVMMIRMEGDASSGGAAKQILSNIDNPTQSRRVMVAFGEDARHEFGHAFADLFDEYIQKRDMDAKFETPIHLRCFSFGTLASATIGATSSGRIWRLVADTTRISAHPSDASTWVDIVHSMFGTRNTCA